MLERDVLRWKSVGVKTGKANSLRQALVCLETLVFITKVSINKGTPKWMVYSGKAY